MKTTAGIDCGDSSYDRECTDVGSSDSRVGHWPVEGMLAGSARRDLATLGVAVDQMKVGSSKARSRAWAAAGVGGSAAHVDVLGDGDFGLA
jgi:hypothetical protein